MPSIITSKSLPLQISKELDNIYRVNMAEAPSEYDKLFKVEKAPSGATYYSAEITGIGLPKEIGEAEGVPYDVPVEGNPMMRTYKQAGLGYIITDLMIKDEQYGKMKKLPADLARSMKLMADIESSAYFNGIDDTEKSRDGAYVCSTHSLLNDVIGHGDQTNRAGTYGDLSETTLKAGMEYFDDVVDELGAPLILTPDQLIVSAADQYIAHRLLTEMYGSTLALGGLEKSATALRNTMNPENGFVARWTPLVSRFITANNWYLRAAEHDMKWYWKEQPKQDSEVDFDTDSIKYKSKMRYGIWTDDYRAVYAGQVA